MDELTRAIAESRLRQYGSEYSSDHLTWEDFIGEAEEVAAALTPLIEARVREARADELEALARSFESEGRGLSRRGNPDRKDILLGFAWKLRTDAEEVRRA